MEFNKNLIAAIVAVVVLVGGIVGGNFWVDYRSTEKVDLYQTEIAELSGDVADLEEAAITPADLKALETKITALRAEFNLLSTDLEELLADSDSSIAELDTEIAAILDRLDDLEVDVDDMWEDLYSKKGIEYQVDWLWDHRYEWGY